MSRDTNTKGKQMVAIGTKVVGCDGFSDRVGQVADHKRDRWGEWHIVAVGGEFVTVGNIAAADAKGIGWRLATDADVRRENRSRERTANC